jgi:short-subunit dehydrogenase
MGTGYELAKLFAQDGYNLIVVARTEQDLEKRQKKFSERYQVEVIPIAKDLFKPNAALNYTTK